MTSQDNSRNDKNSFSSERENNDINGKPITENLNDQYSFHIGKINYANNLDD